MKWTLVFIYLMGFINNLFSQTLTVSNDSLADYTSIQDAINAALPGTLIRVEKGIYTGPVVMKDSVSLEGIDFPVIDGNNTGFVVAMASHTYITGFKIVHSGSETGINDCGILLRNVADATIFANEISNNGHYGIILDNAKCGIHYNQIHQNEVLGIYITDSSEFDIGFNTLQFHEHSGINLVSEHASGNIYNNIIANNHFGIDISTSEPVYPETCIYNNIIYSNNTGISATENYFRNISYNSLYLNYKNHFDWMNQKLVKPSKSNILNDPGLDISDVMYLQLTEKSPCLNRGTNGNDIGVYRYDNGKEKNYAKRADWGKLAATRFVELRGIAVNITNDSTVSDFSGILYTGDGVHFNFKGQYDNIHLFGYLEMTGILVSQQSDPFLKIQFNEGTVFLGNDNSGYPHGFKISHTGSLTISKDSVEGTYKCGQSVPFLNKEQRGVYKLAVTKISGEMKKHYKIFQ